MTRKIIKKFSAPEMANPWVDATIATAVAGIQPTPANLNRAARSVSSVIGITIGAAIAMVSHHWWGSKPQSSVPKLSPSKDSTTHYAPTSQSKVRVTRTPTTSYTSRGVNVRHREYLQEINGSVAFAATGLAVNPALVTSFPWLGMFGANFQTYRINSLRYHFDTETGTTATGCVILTLNPDAADSAPTTKYQALQWDGATRCGTWDSATFSYSKKPEAQRDYFTRTSALASNLDIKTYDVGNFYICTQSQADATKIGELWVEYDVTFQVPQLGTPISGGEITGGTAQTAANPFGTAPTVDTQAFGLSIDTASNVTFAQQGLYVVWYYAVGTVISASTLTATSGCTVTKHTDNGPAAATSWIWIGTVNVTSPGAIVAVTNTATTITSAIIDCAICPLSSTS